MRIIIKSLIGESITLDDIEPENTIHDVKNKIHEKGGVHPDQNRIIFQGKQLIDDLTVQDYNILDESTVHSVLKMRGA